MRQIRLETTSNSSRSGGADETRKISRVVVGQIRLESTSSGADKWSSSGADKTRKMSRLNRKSSNRKNTSRVMTRHTHISQVLITEPSLPSSAKVATDWPVFKKEKTQQARRPTTIAAIFGKSCH